MDPRTAVKVALARKGLNQNDLAKMLDLQPQALSRGLSKEMVNSRSVWPGVLDALGLEVIVREKGSGEK